MKITFLAACLLATNVLSSGTMSAQTPTSLPETPLPATPGVVINPQNAGSSTLQLVNFQGDVNNLYVHSWDEYTSSGSGIAWRRTDPSGTELDRGYLPIHNAADIDVVLYEDGGDYYVLAGYFLYNFYSAIGQCYDIYKFTPGGLVPVSTMNHLSYTPAFGRINVDATNDGLAITWFCDDIGIFVKAASLPGATFGPNVLLPNTLLYKDPDVCIGNQAGRLSLHIAERSTSELEVREQILDFAIAESGASTGLTTEYSLTTGMTFGVPRIDCPDESAEQRWAMVFSEYYYSSTTSTENIYAAVQNTAWSPAPTTVPVHNTYYNTCFFDLNNPVVAYNAHADEITVGWITHDQTDMIPLTDFSKYVAQVVEDNSHTPPASIPPSYMMISDLEGDTHPVLAFSGQNTRSDFDGLHTAYAQFNTYVPGSSCMIYKDKPWTSPLFKMAKEAEVSGTAVSVSPNPFSTALSLTLPLKGHYDISITGIDGRRVYSHSGHFEAMQHMAVPATAFIPGTYLVRISSPENHIDQSLKLMK